jgi:putative redox protein
MTSSGDEGGRWVTSTVLANGYRTTLHARSHELVSDEPVAVGGTDAGPTPYEYLLMALCACTAMTLRMYANRKGWPLDSAQVSARQARSHELDCERCVDQAVGVDRVERRIELIGRLSDEQRQRLMEVAGRCPIGQTLQRGMRIEMSAG